MLVINGQTHSLPQVPLHPPHAWFPVLCNPPLSLRPWGLRARSIHRGAACRDPGFPEWCHVGAPLPVLPHNPSGAPVSAPPAHGVTPGQQAACGKLTINIYAQPGGHASHVDARGPQAAHISQHVLVHPP